MQRDFVVELTSKDAETLHRMAAASGVPAEKIVQHLHRTTLFSVLVSLATDPADWNFPDRPPEEQAKAQAEHFRSWTQTLLEHPYYGEDGSTFFPGFHLVEEPGNC